MKHFLFIILLVGLTTSCEILDVEPTDKIAGETAITDLNGLKAAVNGAYDQMQQVGFAEDAVIFGDLAADNWIHVGSKKEYRQVDDNQLMATNDYVAGIWSSCYDGINRVNNILVQIPQLDNLPPQVRDQHEGECLFLRALNYFTLVKYFGGVPLRKEPTRSASNEELFKERATVEATYRFIISDLKEAEQLLEGAPINPSMAHAYAAKALLARVYLYFSQYENHWQEAADKADQVIESGEFALVSGDNYGALYDEETTNDEIIFQNDFFNDDDQNAIADWTRHDGRLEVAAWDTEARENSIYHAFPPGDKRRDATAYESGSSYYSNKYEDTGNGKDNVILLRLAEMYLIRAEALNEMGYVPNGQAFKALNQIRERAGLAKFYAGDLQNKQQFRLAVEQERRLELAYEGHRFFDLVRTNRAGEVLGDKGNLADNGWLFPIPQVEMDTNDKMEQNGNY